MATALELVSNSGNANLGFGGSNDIPIVTKPENSGFNKMQEVANKMMIQNHQFNKDLFDQKIVDRDSLLAALDKGQVQSGKIDAVDRPAYDKLKKEQDEAFTNFAENGGVNNKEAYQKWIDKTTELKNLATHLQGREIGITQQKADLATEPIKAKQEARQAYLDKQLAKGSGGMIDPYQQSLDFDADKLLQIGQNNVIGGSGVPKAVTSETVRTTQIKGKPDKVTTVQTGVPIGGDVPRGTLGTETTNIIYRNGLPYSVSNQFVDFNKIKQNYNDSFLDKSGEGTELQNQFYDKFTDPNYLSHPEIVETYQEMINKAKAYNAARGFVPQADGSMSEADLRAGAADVKKLGDALNVPIDPRTGKRQIAMSKPELAAYFALAHMNNYKTQTEKLLTDEAKLGIEAEKVRGDLKIKAQEAASKAQLRNAQIKKLQKSTAGKSEAEQAQEYDKEWDHNGVTVLGSKDGVLVYKNSRPIYTQNADGSPKILKPIQGKPVYDKVDANGSPAKDAKVVGYEDGYYKTEFYNKSTGQLIPQETINAAFEVQKKKDPSLTQAQAIENMRKLKNITYRAIGADNQVSNIDDNGNNLRILNNKYKKKDQQDPINDDTDLFEQ